MSNNSNIPDSGYLPIYQTIRGEVVESIHYGAIAIVDVSGNLYAWYGNPQTATFMRSSAKPFQAIPFIEMGGMDAFQITEAELAITCASHSGTDIHTKTIFGLQQKIGVSESDLRCGTHQPFDKTTRALLRDRGEQPSQKHHNCSGKHTGMLGQATIMGSDMESYTEIDHPIQQQILHTVADVCNISPSDIHIGRDGCSVPTFHFPLYHAAWGWAR
ncbi:asparaginase, partial [bacterium]|nr:asparaginase [bacterium]